jgi:hypothetical protein
MIWSLLIVTAVVLALGAFFVAVAVFDVVMAYLNGVNHPNGSAQWDSHYDDDHMPEPIPCGLYYPDEQVASQFQTDQMDVTSLSNVNPYRGWSLFSEEEDG